MNKSIVLDKLKSCFCFGTSDPNGVISGPTVKIGEKLEGKHIMTILDEKWKKKKPVVKKPAIFFSEGQSLSYNQLNTFASCLSKSIIERLGYDYKILNPDNDLVIAICLPMSEKAIAMILGILKTGAAYLPLDPAYPETLLLKIISTFKPVMLITDDNGKIFNKYDTDKFSASVQRLVSIEELWLDVEFAKEPRTRRASMENPWEIEFLENKDKDPSLLPIAVFYSHGLLDNHVGVRLCSRSVLNLVIYLWDKYGYQKNDQCSCTVCIASPISIPQIFIPLLHGCTLHAFRRSDVLDADKFAKSISWRSLTNISITTNNLLPILDAIELSGQTKPFKHLKLVICRGGYVTPEMAKKFFGIFSSGVHLANGSGAIETTCDFAITIFTSLKDYEIKSMENKPLMEHIMANSKIYVVDENMKLVGDGKRGQIYVAGACLALGYSREGTMKHSDYLNKNPFTSSPAFSRIYKTGEYGRIVKGELGKRFLLVEGRQDFIAKIRGSVINLMEVRQHVTSLDAVGEAHVYYYPDLGQLIGFVKLDAGVEPDETLQAEFDFALKNKLPETAIPDEIRIIKQIPACTCSPKKDVCDKCLLNMVSRPKTEKDGKVARKSNSRRLSRFSLKTKKSDA